MQSNTYRQVEGVPEATTFVTNHIHQADSNLAKLLRHSGDEELRSRVMVLGSMLPLSVVLAVLIPRRPLPPARKAGARVPRALEGLQFRPRCFVRRPRFWPASARLGWRASRLPARLGSPRFSAPCGSRLPAVLGPPRFSAIIARYSLREGHPPSWAKNILENRSIIRS